MSTNLDDPVEFIKVLKSQHKSIISTVYEIDAQPTGPYDLKSSTNKLNRITDILFDHLEKEDKQLYPTLLGNNHTSALAKKYYYDMERLSCIALDFFKRYCINREGLKIFIEDFVNGYSLFKGLLKVRIKREETELYPAFVLLQTGVMYSDVLDYVREQDAKVTNKEKIVVLYGDNESNGSALSLALEICGYKVETLRSANSLENVSKVLHPDLVLIDVTKSNGTLKDLIKHLKEQNQQGTHLVGYSTTDACKIEDDLQQDLDEFISKPAVDIEAFSKKVSEILNR